MAQPKVTFSPAEFKQLPLEFVVSAPLNAVVAAQKNAATEKLAFINSLAKQPDQVFSRKVSRQGVDADGNPVPTSEEREISVPLLAITDVPGININSLSVEFDYEISQVYEESKERNVEVGANAGAKGILSGLLNVGLKGSFSSKKSSDYSVNKSGSMSIKLHAGESPVPEGLQKVMTWMVQNIDQESVAAPVPAPAPAPNPGD